MKVIEFRDNELVISDEAYHIRCFRELNDTYPEEATDIFGYMYFMFHPGSDYNYIVDEEEKSETILQALGCSPDFLSYPLYLSCLATYQKMVVTTSSKMLIDNKKRMSKINTYLDNTEVNDRNISSYTKTISEVNKLAVEIAAAEREVFKEVEVQTTKVRGKTELTIGDRGLSDI